MNYEKRIAEIDSQINELRALRKSLRIESFGLPPIPESFGELTMADLDDNDKVGAMERIIRGWWEESAPGRNWRDEQSKIKLSIFDGLTIADFLRVPYMGKTHLARFLLAVEKARGK